MRDDGDCQPATAQRGSRSTRPSGLGFALRPVRARMCQNGAGDPDRCYE